MSKMVGNLPPFVLMLLSALWNFSFYAVAMYVIKQPTTTSILASITLDSQSSHNLGMGISYLDILILQNAYIDHIMTLIVVVCPDAIAEGHPGIIIDNTVGGTTSVAAIS